MTAAAPSTPGLLVPDLPEDSTVKIVGLGGVGGIVARYGAVYLASLARPVRLVCIDGDSYEPSNATRALFARCGNKAAVVVEELLEYFADTDVSLLAVEEYVTAENIARLIREGDHVLLSVDNHATRKLVSDFCGTLQDVVLISGGNDGVEEDAAGRQLRGTYGNCQIYIRRDGRDLSPALTKYHPEIRRPDGSGPTEKNCTELIASVPQILFANLQAAGAILNAFWLYTCDALHYSELGFDIAAGQMYPLRLPAPKLPARAASAPG